MGLFLERIFFNIIRNIFFLKKNLIFFLFYLPFKEDLLILAKFWRRVYVTDVHVCVYTTSLIA